MLDDQSPIDKELNYAILTFNKMTEEQKNAVINKMGDGYEKWQKGLERVGTIGMFEKDISEENISKNQTLKRITKTFGDLSKREIKEIMRKNKDAGFDWYHEM